MSLRPNTSSSSSSPRKKVNKNTGVDAGNFSPRGKNDFVQITKNKLQESIFKKPKEEDNPSSPCLINTDQDILIFKIQHIRTLTQELFSDDPASQLEATTEIWKLLSKGNNALLIEEVIRAGVVPQLVKFLARNDMPQLQSKAACTLTSITSGSSEHTKIVVDNGAVPLLVHLLCCGSDDMKEQVLWVLGNISGDSPSARDDVLSHGALLPLLGLMWNPSIVKPSILKIGSWTLSNLLHGKNPSKLLEQIQPALPFLRNLLMTTNEEVVVSACGTLSLLTYEASSQMIQAVIDANVCPRLVELLQSPESKATVSILITLGSLAMGDEAHIQVLIDNGVLTCVKQLLSTRDRIVIRYACWVVSNITGGNKAPIQDVIDVDLISPLVHLTKAEFVIKREVVCAISNCAYGTPEQIRFLVSKGCIEALCDLLTCPDPTLLTLCLHGLYNILLDGDTDNNITGGVNVYAEKVDKCGGLEKIISLQSYDNDDVYTLAADMVETYWPEEHETVDDEKVHNSEGGSEQG